MRQGLFYLLLVLMLLPAVSASIVSVTTPISAGTYGSGSQIPIILTYDAPVNVSGSPVLVTATGNAVLQTQSGATVTFLYTVPASGANGALSVQSIDTTSGNISDANSTIPANSLNTLTINSATNSNPSIAFAIPAVIMQSSVATNVSISGPTVSTTNAQITGSATQNNVCLNCAITLADGSYTLTVTSTNIVNLTTTSAVNFRVDATPPTISSVQILLPSAIAVSQNQTVDISQTQVNLSVSATDNVSYTLNGAAATTQLQLQAGLNTVVVTANDGVYTTTFTFYIRVSQPFSVAALASALSAKGVTLTAVVNGLDVTGHQSLSAPYLNATLQVANVTYTLTNVYIPGISQSAVSGVIVQTTSNTFLSTTNASVLYLYSNIANLKSVFTQYDSLNANVVYPYTNANVSLISFDTSSSVGNNISRPVISIANGNATFVASGFGVAIAEDAIAPNIVHLNLQSVTDTTATIAIATTEPSSCRITTHVGTYGNMTFFSEFSVPVEYVDTIVTLNNLRAGTAYTYYVSCVDKYTNAMNTSLTLALTTTGTASDQTSIEDTTTTTTTDTTTTNVATTLSSADRALINSLWQNADDYVSITQRDSESTTKTTSTDAATLFDYTSKVTGTLWQTTSYITTTTYDLVRPSGATNTVTQISVRVLFADSVPNTFDVIQAIPKNIATNSNKLYGSFGVLETDPVIRFSFGSGDVSGRELTFSYVVSGNRLAADSLINTFVSSTSAQPAPSTSGSGSGTKPTTTTGSGTTPTTTGAISGTSSGWKIFWWAVVIVLAVIGIVWAVGKIIAKQRGGRGGFGGSGAAYRENFSHRN